MVERDLAKVDVAGSTPVSRSRFSPSVSPTQMDFSSGTLTHSAEARYPSGKGEVCKTFMRRFDSDPRLHNYIDRTSISSGVFDALQKGSGFVLVLCYGPSSIKGTARFVTSHERLAPRAASGTRFPTDGPSHLFAPNR